MDQSEVEIDDQNRVELKRHHEESIDFSLDIREEVDKVFPLSGEASIPDRLSTAKELAECLAHDNLTLSVLLNGKIVLIMGGRLLTIYNLHGRHLPGLIIKPILNYRQIVVTNLKIYQ